MQLAITDWVARWAIYHPDKIALKEYETKRTLTYAQLNHCANYLAHQLQTQYGLEVGDRIAVLAEHGLEYVILFCAAQKAGFVLVPLNYRLTSTELDYLIQDAKPKLIIDDKTFRPKLKSTPGLAHVPHHWHLEDLLIFCEQALQAEPYIFPSLALEEDDPIFILYTSGTTGFPKGALYTHKMLFWNSINTAMSLIINGESRTINCMPPFHTGGWNVLLTPFLHHGAYTCLLKRFDAAQVLQLLEEEKASLFMAVPTMLKMIVEEPAFEKTDLHSLRYIIVGGEAMPIPLINQWHQKGVPIRQGYGMTEVGPNLTSLHQDDAIRKQGSIGRPNYYVSTKIVDAQDAEVEAGQAGELLIKGPMVTPTYWRKPEATQKAIRNRWFYTGDMAIQDDEGFLYIVDRIKNMFISGGENVYPAEVERVLLSHPDVSAAAVIGIPDTRWGEVGQAFLVVSPAFSPSTDDILQFCQANLAKFKVPKSFHFLEGLPKSDTGKIDRRALKNL